MQKVLVTGATGFIGNYVIDLLLQQGHKVIASSLNPEKAKLATWYNKVTYLPFDIGSVRGEDDYFGYFERPDLMIHLAWEGLPNYKADFHLTKNLPLQQMFLENMLRNGLSNLTVAGTCFEYGMKEGCLTESMVCEPANSYAIAKNQLRLSLEKTTAAYGAGFKWIRLFYMYGKGQSAKSLFSQLDCAIEQGDTLFNMSGGEQVRDFLPIAEVAGNIVSIALQNKVTGIINCCSGKPVMVKDLVREYLVLKQKHIELNLGFYPYADYEAMRFWGDVDKLNKTLNRSC